MKIQARLLLRTLAAFYILAFVLYGVAGGLALLRDNLRYSAGTLAYTSLPLEELELVSTLVVEDSETPAFVSTDGDPQLLYTFPQKTYVSRVRFSAVPHKPAGEITLHYTTAPGDDFNEKQKLWAKQDTDGSWYFDLPSTYIYALRLDPGTAGGVIWQFDTFTLNEKQPPMRYFTPSPLQFLLLLLGPGFAVAFVAESERIWRQGRKRPLPGGEGSMKDSLQDIIR